MAYEDCPKCGTRKHHVVDCPNCGFSRSKPFSTIPLPKKITKEGSHGVAQDSPGASRLHGANGTANEKRSKKQATYKLAKKGAIGIHGNKAAEYQTFLSTKPITRRNKKKRANQSDLSSSYAVDYLTDIIAALTSKVANTKTQKAPRRSTGVWLISGGGFESNRRRH